MQRRSSVAEFELRTALTAIAGWADTLREWQSLSSAQVDRAVAILGARAADACRLAEDLVADVEAELSTLALHPVLVDLVALLEASVRPYVGASMGREIVVLSHVPIWAQVDPVAFRKVCAHLIENAVDNTPQGGTISVRIRQVGDRAEIEFSDEGIGIPEGVDVFAPTPAPATTPRSVAIVVTAQPRGDTSEKARTSSCAPRHRRRAVPSPRSRFRRRLRPVRRSGQESR